MLEPLLPAGRQPPDSDAGAAKAWREGLQHALVAALDEVQATFACTGFTAGTTVTILIQARAHMPHSFLGHFVLGDGNKPRVQ